MTPVTGLPLNAADKRHIVDMMLTEFPERSDSEMSAHCGIPRPAFTARRKAMYGDSHPSPVSTVGWVYVIGSRANSLVKIGTSLNVEERLRSIQFMSPVPLRLLWKTPGDAELETRLHQLFQARRRHGEWFDFSDMDPVVTITNAVLS